MSPRNVVQDREVAGFVPMAAINDGYGGAHTFEERPWSEIKKGYTHLADGDIAVAKITPCFQNRKSIVISGLPNGVGAGTTELHVLRPFDELVAPRYLLIVLKSGGFIDEGVSRMTGTAGQQRVPRDYFGAYPVAVPPLAEQHRMIQERLTNSWHSVTSWRLGSGTCMIFRSSWQCRWCIMSAQLEAAPHGRQRRRGEPPPKAIKEGFIDVLQNYTTYQTCWNFLRSTVDDCKALLGFLFGGFWRSQKQSELEQPPLS